MEPHGQSPWGSALADKEFGYEIEALQFYEITQGRGTLREIFIRDLMWQQFRQHLLCLTGERQSMRRSV
jgi:hypothetical protein